MRVALLLFGAAVWLAAQAPQRVWVVRKVSPPPVSREEWVEVSFQFPMAGYILDGRSRPDMTLGAARLARDLSAMGSDFNRSCDRSYSVVTDTDGNLSVPRPGLFPPPLPNFTNVQSNMCCEEAMNAAFPTTNGQADCRGLRLRSNGGRIMLKPGGFVSTTGMPVTVGSIVVPPAVFTPVSMKGARDWVVCRRTRPPASRNDWYAVERGRCGPGYEVAPEHRPGLTFSEAIAIADGVRAGPTFLQACDRSYYVIQNQNTGAMSVSDAFRPPLGLGDMIVRNNLCCEEATNIARPTTISASDCRALALQTGGRVFFGPGGPIPLPGAPILVPVPGLPPVVVMPPPPPIQPGMPMPGPPTPRMQPPGGPGDPMPMPGGGGNVSNNGRPPDLPPGPAGSLPLVKSEVSGKNHRDRWGNGCDYTATSVMCESFSDEAGSCGGKKDSVRSEWTFSAAPGSLPRGGEVTITVTGTVTACPDAVYKGLDLAAGVTGAGLNATVSDHAFYYRGNSRLQGKYTFKVPADAESARLEFWLYGKGHAGHYTYGKVK